MKALPIGQHFVDAINAGGWTAVAAIILLPVWILQELVQLLLLGLQATGVE